MPERLTEIWLKMKRNGIKQREIAKELNCTEQYLSMIFNGKKTAKGIFDRINTAIDTIISERGV